jgi:hypothetical protein
MHGPTGTSMHCLSFCSNCAQPWTLYPDEAQQPVDSSQPYCSVLSSMVCLHPSTSMTCIPDRPSYVPRTDDMAPRQGLASGLLGRRTRSLGSGGSGRCVTDETAWPWGLGTIVGGGGGGGEEGFEATADD